MPKSRNNPQRQPMGRRYPARHPLNKKRSKTRAKQRAGLKARIAKSCRQLPGACFINGEWQLPYRYGWVERPTTVVVGFTFRRWERIGPLYPELAHLY